jgi:hypothetical protein
MSPSYIPARIRQRLTEEAGYRCGYCLSAEVLAGIPLTIDHIIPSALGGTDDPENLWMACRPCNELKGIQTHAENPETGEMVPLFNPRVESWHEHFQWDEEGAKIKGITSVGKATVIALQLNRELLVKARVQWVMAGWHPPV